MNRTVYMPYRMARDKMLRMAKDHIPKSVRKKSREDVLTHVIGEVLRVPGVNLTIDANVLVDEEQYLKDGCRMYFPESPALLEMLWRAHMDVDLSSLELEKFPKAFSVAWPRCEIEGVSLPGCLVTIMTGHQYEALFMDFGKRYLGHPLEMVTLSNLPKDVVGLHVSYWGDEIGTTGMPYLYHCAIPEAFVKKCLKSEGDYSSFLKVFDTLNNAMVGVDDLDTPERHAQFVMVREIIHLLVYMQAFPNRIVDGVPDGRRSREFVIGDWIPTVINAPDGLGGSHASPETHYRTWHFRSYPTKRDGTKQKGVVFVNACIVNAGTDPKTVEYEDHHSRAT